MQRDVEELPPLTASYRALVETAQANTEDAVMPGYTICNAHQPVTFAHWCRGQYVNAGARDESRLDL